ncbi:uncharacterized protein [Cicer arietinum]|uniref:uncharacterized protein n=1 Tax=Cicer arietinum TaxID=3827 RepID=UPI003CC5EC36
MARSNEDGEQECEDMRARLEFAEALAKKHEDQIVDLMNRLNQNHKQASPFHEGIGSSGDRNEEVHRREKWRKLEIPIFAGDDAFGWTHRLERYFLLKEVTEEEKMQATVMALEGKALSWYHWWEKCNPNSNWEGFKIVVVRRFQPLMIQNPFEQLLSLKQTGTLEEYVENFEKYVGAMRTIDQEFVRGIFLNGLKQELQAEVKLYEINSLSEMIQKVLLIEQKNMLINMKPSYSYATRNTGNSHSIPYTKTVTLESKLGSDQRNSSLSGTGQNLSVDSVKNRGGEFKHLTNAEIREKKEKKGYVSGFTTTKSWKVEGIVEGNSVVILIDCGASHNFIATELVGKLKLKVMETPSYLVEVGDVHKVRCKGKIGLAGKFGRNKADFGKLELTVKQGEKVIKIYGNPTLAKTELPFGALMQVLKEEGERLLIQYAAHSSKSQSQEALSQPFLQLLEEYGDLFTDPKELPPIRRHDHAIHLKEGAAIPNLRPYKYPHYQKTEIERLVGEMLDSGVIRPNISPYSSPIILVKKKDGGWRFCVDYRALNKIATPNKFPIPIIEELLDEIGGATIFTKLDLKSGYH